MLGIHVGHAREVRSGDSRVTVVDPLVRVHLFLDEPAGRLGRAVPPDLRSHHVADALGPHVEELTGRVGEPSGHAVAVLVHGAGVGRRDLEEDQPGGGVLHTNAVVVRDGEQAEDDPAQQGVTGGHLAHAHADVDLGVHQDLLGGVAGLRHTDLGGVVTDLGEGVAVEIHPVHRVRREVVQPDGAVVGCTPGAGGFSREVVVHPQEVGRAEPVGHLLIGEDLCQVVALDIPRDHVCRVGLSCRR